MVRQQRDRGRSGRGCDTVATTADHSGIAPASGSRAVMEGIGVLNHTRGSCCSRSKWGVAGKQHEVVLDGQGRDPDVVRRDGGALLPKLEEEAGVVMGGLLVGPQDPYPGPIQQNCQGPLVRPARRRRNPGTGRQQGGFSLPQLLIDTVHLSHNPVELGIRHPGSGKVVEISVAHLDIPDAQAPGKGVNGHAVQAPSLGSGALPQLCADPRGNAPNRGVLRLPRIHACTEGEACMQSYEINPFPVCQAVPVPHREGLERPDDLGCLAGRISSLRRAAVQSNRGLRPPGQEMRFTVRLPLGRTAAN